MSKPTASRESEFDQQPKRSPATCRTWQRRQLPSGTSRASVWDVTTFMSIAHCLASTALP